MIENLPKDWKRTHKKSYNVHICMPKIGTKVKNKFEGTEYVTSENKPFVIKGTAGEMWVIDAGKLMSTYNFADGVCITVKGLKRLEKNGLIGWTTLKTKPTGENAPYNWAVQLPINNPKYRNLPVTTSWGDVLYANRPRVAHAGGDYLLCADVNGHPNFNDMWVVNGEIFETTYDMRSFRKSTKK